MVNLTENIHRLEEQIAHACRRAGRRREEVELMAVSKTYSAERIVEAVEAGLTLFGENRVQEFAEKVSELHPLRARQEKPLRVHLIGHLQSNKAAKAAELFDAVDSVDSLRLARRLDNAASQLRKRLPILVEVKLSPEETKEGLNPDSVDAAQLFETLSDFQWLHLCGLMTIAPWGAEEAVTRACFRSLREWRDRWAAKYPRLNFDVLSMGMSGDFPLAIAEGATLIRVGTAIFGKRAPYKGPA